MSTKHTHEVISRKWGSIDYVLFTLSFSSLLLGTWGWLQYYKALNDSLGFDTAVIKSLQLFVMSGEFGTTPVPLALNIARFVSPILLATAIIKQLVFATSKRMDALKVSLTFKNHYVVCGFGAVGKKIADDCLKKGIKLVIIERDIDKVYMNDVVRRGAIVIIGDATELLILKKANIGKAAVLFATTASDTVNIQISFLVKGIFANMPSKRNEALRCLIHIAESSIGVLLYNSEYCQVKDKELDLIPFNINNYAAGIVLDRFAPDKYVESIHQGEQPIHVFIIGLGNIGENLLLNFARTCHYPCNIPSDGTVKDILNKNTVHVLDTNIAERMNEIRTLYPKLDQVVDLKLINKPIKSFGQNDLVDLVKKNPVKVLYICLEDDVERFTITQNIQEYLLKNQISVINLIPVKSNLEALAKGDCTLLGRCDEKIHTIQTFNIIEETCKIDILVKENLNKAAKVLNAIDIYSSQLADVATIEKKWESTPEVFRQSSRHSAEHLKVKLRAMGLYWATVTAGDIKHKIENDEALAETLEHIEHIRFVAERFLDGWEPADKSQVQEINDLRQKAKNNDPDAKKQLNDKLKALKKIKINHTLIPFKQLTEEDKTFNKKYISRMNELMALIKS